MNPVPPAVKKNGVHDAPNRTTGSDPYGWLEDIESSNVRAWVQAQNERSQAFLERTPLHATLADRLSQLFGRPRVSAPWRRGENWFQFRNDGRQEFDVLFVMSNPEDDGRVLLDPNSISAGGLASVGATEVSWDGRLLAWVAVESGSDWGTVRFREVATGKDLEDTIAWVMLGLAWAADSRSLYYARFSPPAEGERFRASNLCKRLYLHVLGTPQAADQVVFERPNEPTWAFPEPRVTDRYLVLEISEGSDYRSVRLFALDLRRPESGFIELTHGEAMYHVAGGTDDTLYVCTDRDAPLGRVVAIDVKNPEPDHWRDLVPEGEGSLVGYDQVCAYAGGALILTDTLHSIERLRVVDVRDGAVREVELPFLGWVTLAPNPVEDEVVYLEIDRFADPPVIARLDVVSGAIDVLESTPRGLDGDDVVVEQDFARSIDGVMVPLLRGTDGRTRRTGDVPVLMTGYGGFGYCWTPRVLGSWQVARAWIELGGMVVSTNLRGGSEYGRGWHEAGRRGNKQNVFDDFAACARHLMSSGWTRPDRIAINGGSNGGLLVGASEVQRPDLYGACIPEVAVLDMLRYHKFTSGVLWLREYGNPDVPEEYAWLEAYSPVHNASPGVSYPATLVMASYNDDRVVPSHSFKFAAALQVAQAGNAPILLRTEPKIGHGGGKPVSMQVRDRADVLAFAAAALGVTDKLSHDA